MVAMLLSFFGVSIDAQTITQDFNGTPSGVTDLPEGWHAQSSSSSWNYYMSWQTANGVDGTGCFKFNSASSTKTLGGEKSDYIVTEAKKGTVKFVCTTVSKMDNPSLFTNTYVGIFKMTDNGNGTYTPGEKLVSYGPPITDYDGVKAGFVEVSAELDEDCLIGINGSGIYVDNYENIPAGGGGGGASTFTDLENFNTVGPNVTWAGVPSESLPEGWTSIGGKLLYGWPATDGVDGTACLKFAVNQYNPNYSQTSNAYRTYLVKKVKKGTISFMIKAASSYYLSDARAPLGLYEVTPNSDGSFPCDNNATSVGTELVFYEKLSEAIPDISNTEFKEFTYTIDHDMWLAIFTNQVFFDNFSNTYEVAAATHTVSGVVKDEAGAAIAGAEVSLTGMNAVTTGEDGAYSFADVPEAELTLAVKAAGYESYSTTLNVTADMTQDVVLKQIVTTVNVTCTNITSGANVGNATLSLYDEETPVCENVTMNEDGVYPIVIKGALKDKYILKGSAPRYQDFSYEIPDRYIKFTAGQTTTGKAYFYAKKGTFKATVLNENNEYVTNATVVLKVGDKHYTTTNNQDGTYTTDQIDLSLVEGVDCIASCTVPDMKPIADQTIRYDGDVTEMEVNFLALTYQNTVLTGKVVMADSETVVAGAEVTLLDGETTVGTATTDDQGVYSISWGGEIPAALNLNVKATYYNEATFELTELVREQQNTFDVNLAPVMVNYSASVMNGSFQQIEGAKVVFNGEEIIPNEYGGFNTSIWAGEFATYTQGIIVTASAEGYEDMSKTIYYIPGNTDATDTFILNVKMYNFSVKVADAEGQVLENVEVAVADAAGNAVELTDKGYGLYTFSVDYFNLPEGDYKLTVSCKNYDTVEETFNFANSQEVKKEIEMIPTALTLTVKVVDAASDEAIADAVVVISTDEETWNAENKGAGEYEYATDAVAADGVSYICTVTAEGYEPATTDAFNFDMGSLLLTVRLDKVNAIDAIFADGRNVATVGGKLYVNGEAAIYSIDGKLVRVVRNNGAAEVPGLAPGLYIVAGQKVLVK